MGERHVGPELRQLGVDEGRDPERRCGAGLTGSAGRGHIAHARSQAATPWRSTIANPRLGPASGPRCPSAIRRNAS